MAESETQEKPKALTVKKGVIAGKPAIVIAGVGGVGKTTQASKASPKTILIDAEKGSHWISVDRIDVENWTQFSKAVKQICESNHDYDTIVLDSWDRICEMLDNHVVAEASKTSNYIKAIGDFESGKGYVKASKTHGDTLDYLDKHIRGKMQIIIVCHVEASDYRDDPTLEAYKKYQIKMRTKMASRLREWSDFCLFAKDDKDTRQTGTGWNKRVVASGDPMKRWVHTAGTDVFDCKSRIPLLSEEGEPVFEFTWENIEAAMKRGLKR